MRWLSTHWWRPLKAGRSSLSTRLLLALLALAFTLPSSGARSQPNAESRNEVSRSQPVREAQPERGPQAVVLFAADRVEKRSLARAAELAAREIGAVWVWGANSPPRRLGVDEVAKGLGVERIAAVGGFTEGYLDWKVGTSFELPEPVDRAVDVRWSPKGGILVAVPASGVARLGNIEREMSVSWETRDGHAMNELVATDQLAVSDEFLLPAARMLAFGWKRHGGDELRVNPFFESLEDVDLQSDRFVALGVQRGPSGQPAPDGVIAWTGRIGGERLAEPAPLHVSSAGPGALPMLRCMAFGIGVVRFLSDGEVVVVPGVESGLFKYSASGKLLDTWSSEKLDIGVDCSFDQETDIRLASDLGARARYLNRFRTVDEILVLDGTPHLVVRWVEDGGTRWELIALEPRGKTSRKPLSVESPSRFAHIRGDVRDGRVVLLVFDEMMFLPTGDPEKAKAEPTRIVVLEAAKKSVEVEEPRKVGTR